jgi:hypothetical protein
MDGGRHESSNKFELEKAPCLKIHVQAADMNFQTYRNYPPWLALCATIKQCYNQVMNKELQGIIKQSSFRNQGV